MSLAMEELKSPWAEIVNAKSQNKAFYPVDKRAAPSGCALPQQFLAVADEIANMHVRDDDVWIVTFPKCGTTWSQEMIWLIANNCDFEGAKKSLLTARFPFLEFNIVTSDPGCEGNTLEASKNMKPPRFIKSHLPKSLLPKELWTKKPKIIYVARNPKDAAVSYYHHYKMLNGYTGSLDDFLEAFLDDSLMYCPYWDHTLEFWNMRHEPNILFNTYEEMKQDLPAVIRRTARFLGSALSEAQVAALAQHLSFPSMRANDAVNREEGMVGLRRANGLSDDHRFIRQGVSGAWRKEMAPEVALRFDKWIDENIAGTGYKVGVSGHKNF